MGILKGIYLSRNNPILSLSILLLLSTRLITLVAFPTPIASPDTPTYYSGKFLDFSLVSFTGNASRGWLVPFIYALMPNAVCLEIFQLLFSGLAWAFLLYSVQSAKLMPKRSTNFTILFIGVLGSTPQVFQHDTSVLSTSITNSIFIWIISFSIKAKYLNNASPVNLAAVILLSGLLMIQKTSFIPIAVGLCVALILYSRTKLPSRKRVVVLAALLVLTFYSSFVGSNVDKNWQISYSGQTLLWQLGGQSPSAREFSSFLQKQGAPDCVTNEAPFQNINTSIGKILNSCPEAKTYLERGIQRDFAKFVILYPSATARLSVFGLGASLTSSATNYGNTVSVLPKFVGEIFFGTTTPQLLSEKVEDQVSGFNVFKSGAAFWLSTPFIGWILLALTSPLLRGRKSQEDGFLYSILAFCLIQSVFVVILLPSEWVRQTSPFIIGALICSVILSIKNIQTIISGTAKNDK